MPAAGLGRRFGEAIPKQYVSLAGRTVLEWALAPFLSDPRCMGIVVALAPGDPHWPAVARRLPPLTTAVGGMERSESVRLALEALAGRAAPEDWVLVHDAARPCLTAADRDRLLDRLADHPVGGLLAVRAADTLKRAGSDDAVDETVDRSRYWRALTPQMFRYGRLTEALERAAAQRRFPTDEAQAMEWLGERPVLVEGSARNIKITSPEDLELAAAFLEGGGAVERKMRIGTGIDVHAFGPGDHVMLGGVRVPHRRGVIAHSDGDVVLHAVCDALLGAAGLGDIGQHFRDDDPRWAGADSREFVRAAMAMLRGRGLSVANCDVTLLAQEPRIGPYRDEMRRSLAELLEVEEDRVNIKATTTERLGFLGRAEGIAAQAVVLLTGD